MNLTLRSKGGALLPRIALVVALAAAATPFGDVASSARAEAPAPQPTPQRATPVRLDPATMTDEQLATSFPDEYRFLSSEFGLDASGAADALRLTWQAGSTRQWAMATVAGYAGTWVDYRKGSVFVGVAGGPQTMAVAQRHLGEAPGGARRTALVAQQRSMTDLIADAQQMERAIDPTGTAAVHVQIDERGNGLLVEGVGAEAAQHVPAVAQLMGKSGATPVSFRAAEVAGPSDVSGGWDGRQTVGCTMAFTVVNPANQRAVLTAGHCVDNAPTVAGVTLSGPQYDRSFWNNAADAGYDRQLHVVPSGTMTVGALQQPNVIISGSFQPAVGSVICRYGAASVAKGQSPAFCSLVSGYGYDGFVGMQYGCIYGDSGGPIWVMGKAVGISAITTDPLWPVDASSNCYAAPINDQLNGTGYYLQDATFGYGSDFRNIGLFHPIAPTRVLDTRTSGPRTGEIDVPLNSVLNYTDLGSVALSITIVPRGVAGTAQVYPGDDGVVPLADDVSFPASAAESNLVISRVNRYTQSVKVNVSQSVNVIVDVLGYFSDASGTIGAGGATKVVGLAPARVYDSRTIAPLPAGTSRDIQVRGIGGVPANATAVLANLTVTRVTGTGWLAGHAGGSAWGGTSNLNYVAGDTKARLAIVPLDASGRIRLTTGGAGQIDAIVDVQGYFTSATTANVGRTFALQGGGGRLLDTRTGSPVAAGDSVCVDVYASRTEAGNGLPREGLSGVWLALSVTGVGGSGYATVSPGGQPTAVSNVNFVADESRTNSVFVATPSATDGIVCVKVSTASAHVVVDVLAMTTA